MKKDAVNITWWDKCKHAVARYWLASEVAKVDLERETYLRLKEDLERRRAQFEEEKAGYTITDMVREQLQAFNPRLLDDEDDLPGILGEVEAQDEFLSKMNTLSKNESFQLLMDYLVRNQVVYVARYAENTDKMNFGRATINGFELVKDEITRLAVIYQERHPIEEDYDKTSAI